jgi:hypothetical protein
MFGRSCNLSSEDARTTRLPEHDNNPSRLAIKYLDSVADHNIRHRPSSNLPFHPIVSSLGGMMNGSTTKVFARGRQGLVERVCRFKTRWERRTGFWW